MFITKQRTQHYGFLEMTNIYNAARHNSVDFVMLNGYEMNHARMISLVGIMNPEHRCQSIYINYDDLGIADHEYISNFHADYNSEILRLTITSDVQETEED